MANFRGEPINPLHLICVETEVSRVIDVLIEEIKSSKHITDEELKMLLKNSDSPSLYEVGRIINEEFDFSEKSQFFFLVSLCVEKINSNEADSLVRILGRAGGDLSLLLIDELCIRFSDGLLLLSAEKARKLIIEELTRRLGMK